MRKSITAADTRNVCIPGPEWAGLGMIAKLTHRSRSAVIRDAVARELHRYGLAVADGELTVNPALWPAEIQQGGGNPRRRKIHEGGATSTPEDPATSTSP